MVEYALAGMDNQLFVSTYMLQLPDKKTLENFLLKQLGKDPTTISKWCTNQSQPTLEILLRIAELLDVNYTELVSVK